MRGHSDICLPAYGSINDTSVGCSCTDISRMGNPCFVIGNSLFFPSSKVTIVRHRKVGAWSEESARINLAFVLLPISIWILFARWTLFNPQDQGDSERGGKQHRCTGSEQSDTIQSMAGFVCPCRRAFYCLPPLVLPILGSCCVINNKVQGTGHQDSGLSSTW